MHAEMCIYIFLVCPSEMHIVILYHEMRERKRKKKRKQKRKQRRKEKCRKMKKETLRKHFKNSDN